MLHFLCSSFLMYCLIASRVTKDASVRGKPASHASQTAPLADLPALSHTCSDVRQHRRIQVFTLAHGTTPQTTTQQMVEQHCPGQNGGDIISSLHSREALMNMYRHHKQTSETTQHVVWHRALTTNKEKNNRGNATIHGTRRDNKWPMKARNRCTA